MSLEPFVTVIVLNYNGKRFLGNCFSSLGFINYPKSQYEVLLVDNGSTDGSAEFVAKEFPWVRIIRLSQNFGFGGGNNRGAKFAKGDYIAFLNNDTQVSKDWLIELVKASIDNSVSICAGKTVLMKNPNLIDYAGGKFTINGRGYSVGFLKPDDDKKGCFFTAYPCAASMLVNATVFRELGGFDETYFACLDDTDLGWRGWLSGYKTLFCPSSFVYHYYGGTVGEGRISPLKTFHGTKGPMITILKNLELKNLFFGFILALSYDLVEVLLLVRSSNSECLGMKLKAYFWLIHNLTNILRKRQSIQNNRKFSDKWLLDMGFLATLSETFREYSRLSKLTPQD